MSLGSNVPFITVAIHAPPFHYNAYRTEREGGFFIAKSQPLKEQNILKNAMCEIYNAKLRRSAIVKKKATDMALMRPVNINISILIHSERCSYPSPLLCLDACVLFSTAIEEVAQSIKWAS